MRSMPWLTGQSMQDAEIRKGALRIWFGAVPTASGGLDPQAVARCELSLGLGGDRPAVQQVATGLPGLASVPAFRRMPPSLGDQREAHRLPGLELANDP